jgi:hypothetical protein
MMTVFLAIIVIRLAARNTRNLADPSRKKKKRHFNCPGSVAKWSSRPPPVQINPGSITARV